MPKFQAPRGTRDLLPADMATWRRLEDEARRLSALYGFQPIETPMFEDSAVIERGIGAVTDIVEKELFRVRSPGSADDRWALRPEATAGVARAYVQHGMQTLPQPVRLTTFGSMFRYDRPQAGRFRQFWQWNVEAIGDPGPAIDAEILELAYRYVRGVGVANVEVHLNTIGDSACRPVFIAALVEYLGKYEAELPELERRRLTANPLRVLDSKDQRVADLLADAPVIDDFLCAACRDHFDSLLAHLSALDVAIVRAPRLVRGLDYYTRTAFEIYQRGAEGQQSALGGGGRYDGLLELFGARPTPAIGFALGIDRIAAAAVPSDGIVGWHPVAVVVGADPAATDVRLRLATDLRAAGVAATADLAPRRLGRQLEGAARDGAHFAIVVGDELDEGQVQLRDLEAGTQRAVNVADLVRELQRAHASHRHGDLTEPPLAESDYDTRPMSDEGRITLATAYRTHTAGELRPADAGTEVTLAGWVHRRRDLGQLIFIDLRDRHGLTQVVIDAAESPAAHEVGSGVRSEFVLRVTGKVAKRREGTENAKLATGEIEVRAESVEVLSTAETPPFPINDAKDADEPLRLKYRYLDLRREQINHRMVMRSQLLRALSEVHHRHGFVEVETPLLIKSTPEGARDFIVPSRVQPGNIYALPQSPQQLKQLLMVAGFDRYFQIAHCMRDEDSRADRGPEFTQLDLEMSFVSQEDVMGFVESMVAKVTRSVVPDRPLRATPFPRLSYREAIDRYGSDKPDVRFAMELRDLASVVAGSGFGVFDSALESGGRVFGMAVPGMGGASRSQTDELTERAKKAGAKGLVHMSVGEGGAVSSPIAKFLDEGKAEQIVEAAGAAVGDLVLIVADADIVAQEVLGDLRAELGQRLGLVTDSTELSYVWVYSFPMYKWDADNKRWDATHNPFSGVNPEDEELLVTASGDSARPSPADPAGRARALQHDLVLNGWELGGGSIRIHRRDLLERSFALQGHTIEGMRDKFGAVLDAFEYGAPPHGGIALGIDRWIALLTNQVNIREVQAFPKTGTGSDLMLGAPSPVEAAQLAELGLQLAPAKAKAENKPS